MKGRTSVLVRFLMCAVALLVVALTAQAQDLPDGVSVKVLAEFPSDTPGIEKIRLLEFRMEPGAKWEGEHKDTCKQSEAECSEIRATVLICLTPGMALALFHRLALPTVN